jgi:hypothetical protein
MTPSQTKVERIQLPEQEAYWRTVFVGDLPNFNLGDYPRSPVQFFVKKGNSWNLGQNLVRKLDDFAARQGAGSSVVLLAVTR